jgi:hypothetical protein
VDGVTTLPDAALTGHAARRAERLAAARALLESPPPLDALGPRRVTVHSGEVVHASRSRPVVRWEVSVETDRGRATLPVVGKAFHKGDGERAGQLLAALREAGFDDPRFGVPRPLGWDPGRRLLAQEEAPRGTLHALLDDHLDEPGPPRRVGQWLARLHTLPRLPVPPLAEDFEERKLAEYGAALALTLPSHASRVEQLAEATRDALQRLDLPRVPTHGDYQPKNVHLDALRVVVIDFDRAALAPAARDLGHFIGQTRTMAASRHGSLDSATRWVQAFLEGYAEDGGSPEAAAAAPLYVARTFAEVLFYRLVVRPVGHTSFVPAWLDAWETCLVRGDPA